MIKAKYSSWYVNWCQNHARGLRSARINIILCPTFDTKYGAIIGVNNVVRNGIWEFISNILVHNEAIYVKI